jgi:hypothetical protein
MAFGKTDGSEECAICLSQFEEADQVIQLPCNVKSANG